MLIGNFCSTFTFASFLREQLIDMTYMFIYFLEIIGWWLRYWLINQARSNCRPWRYSFRSTISSRSRWTDSPRRLSRGCSQNQGNLFLCMPWYQQRVQKVRCWSRQIFQKTHVSKFHNRRALYNWCRIWTFPGARGFIQPWTRVQRLQYPPRKCSWFCNSNIANRCSQRIVSQRCSKWREHNVPWSKQTSPARYKKHCGQALGRERAYYWIKSIRNWS